MILYQIDPSQSDYLLQQEVTLHLRIKNQGETPLEVPAPDRADNSMPVFAISGPGFPQARQFSNWSVSHPGADAGPGADLPPNQEMTLAPSETWEGELALNTMLGLREPGEYRIGSMLRWQTGQARSPDRTFRLSLPDPYSIDLGTGVRPFDAGEGELVFLQRGVGSSTVYSGQFRESDPSNSEVALSSLVRRATVPANATDIASPHRNTPFFDEPLQWIVWREGRSIKTLHTAETTPQSFDLPADLASLVRPPLKAKGGPVEVLAVSADHRHLYMVSVEPNFQSRMSLAWQVDLPGTPQSITAALGPETRGNLRHIAFAVQRQHGVEIFHATYQAGQKPVPFQISRIEQGQLLANAPLSMLVTGDGVAHVAVLVKTGAEQGALVEAEFGPGSPAPAKIQRVNAFPDVTAASILYTDKGGQIVRRDVVFLAGGELRKLQASGQLQTLSVSGKALVPLQLTAGQDQSYVLCLAPDGSFSFQPL